MPSRYVFFFLPPAPLRLRSRGPFLSCCELCVAESRGTWSASPLHADLQPLICGPHDGVTSLKDVVGLSAFEPDVVFDVLKSADGGFLGLFSSRGASSTCSWLLHSSFTQPFGSGPRPGRHLLTGAGLSWKFLVEGSCLKSGDLACRSFSQSPSV